MRLVLDTDVIVAGLRSPGRASAALLRAIRQGKAVMMVSATMLIEYEAVCQLAEHRIAAGLIASDVDAFLDGLAFLAEPVEVHFRWRPQLRDPADEMVLEAAVNGRADAIVTFNRRDYSTIRDTFGIDVMSPADALRRVVA